MTHDLNKKMVTRMKLVNYEKRNKYINIIKNYFDNISKKYISVNSISSKNISFSFKHNIDNKLNLFNSSSSSITKCPNDSDIFIMNTRIVNYYLDKVGKSSNDGKCVTINRVTILDKFLNVLSFKYLFPSNYDNKYVGIEDVRLFNFNEELYFIGSLYNSEKNKVQIVSNKYKLGNDYEPIIINPSFKTDFNWEKNWVFFNNNNDLNIIYKWYPIYICKINYETKELNLIKSIENLPPIFNKFRGSTCGIEYDNKIWFIVHQQNTVVLEIKNYLHNFVVFDKNMNLLGYSDAFNFENKLVEFCIGMIISNDNFIITYSTLDSTSNIVVFSPNYVNTLIRYI
jgi:hypothetical protein